MAYPPYCLCCSSKAHWSSDWDAQSDFGYEHNGVIGLYICSNTETCGAHMEIRDLFITENEEERSIKYYFDYNEDYTKNNIDTSINYCLYCRNPLEIKEPKPTDKNGEYSEGITTECSCPKCNATYDIEDIYPIEEVFPKSEENIDLYDSRTIILK